VPPPLAGERHKKEIWSFQHVGSYLHMEDLKNIFLCRSFLYKFLWKTEKERPPCAKGAGSA